MILTHKRGILLALLSLFAISGSSQNLERVEGYLNQLKKSTSDSLFIDLNMKISDEYIFNNADTAQYFAEQALQRATERGNRAAMAKANNYIGIIHYSRGQYFSALEYYSISEMLYREVNDLGGVYKAMNNRGIILTLLEDHERAVAIYNEAYEGNVNLGNFEPAGSNLFNLIGSCLAIKDYNCAKIRLQDLKELNTRSSEKVDPSGLLAEMFFGENNMDSAYYYFRKAYLDKKEEGDEYFVSKMLLGLVDVAIRRGDFLDAERSLGELRTLVNKNGFDEVKLSVIRQEAELLRLLGRPQEAYRMILKYTEQKDSLTKANHFARISELNVKYEMEKRENQINFQQQMLETRTSEYRFVLFIIGAMLVIAGLGIYTYTRKLKHNSALKAQNNQIKIQRQKILSSIDYARKIQRSILPKQEIITESLPDSLIYFKPRDIVSGDFYWYKKIGNTLYVAIVDCTGHGVPGAFMSIIANNKLNKVINELGLRKPEEILFAVHQEITKLLSPNGEGSTTEGMDLSLCALDMDKHMITYSGANNGIHVLSGEKIQEFKPTPLSIGGRTLGSKFREGANPFKSIEIPFTPGDYLFMYTDGMMDQLGGAENKKMNKERFRQLLADIKDKALSTGVAVCDDYLNNWRKNQPQTDDILLFATRL